MNSIRPLTYLRRSFNKTLLFLSSLVILMIAISCKKESIYAKYTVETIDPTGNEKYLNESSDYIFDQNALHTFELSIPVKDLNKIDSDPTAEEYVEGTLKFNGEVISPVWPCSCFLKILHSSLIASAFLCL